MRISMRDSFNQNPAKGMAGKPKKIANNTFEYVRECGSRVVRLHLTDILIIHPDGSIRLDSGGWQTVTTKGRINDYLPSGFGIYSERGVWYVCYGGKRAPYFDGMTLPQDFKPNPEKEKAQRKLLKSINQFVKRIDDMEALPMPDSGDCWHCSMFDKQQPADKSQRESYWPQGTAQHSHGDNGHLIDHMRENYLHGSLIVNAMRWCGYSDEAIGIHLGCNIGTTSVKSALRRYLKRRLGLPA